MSSDGKSKEVRKAIAVLADAGRHKGGKALPPADNARVIPKVVGRAKIASSTTGGGIASPLKEKVDSRVYYPATDIHSSDGLFTIVYKEVKTMKFTDSNGQTVEVQYVQTTV